jgi:hypothetical protein
MQRMKVPAGDSRLNGKGRTTHALRAVWVPVLHAEFDAERDVDASGGLHEGEVLGGVGRHEAERADAGLPHQRAELAEAEVPVRRRGQLQGRVQVRPVPEELEHAHLCLPVRRQRGGHLRAALHAPPRRARREGQLGLVGGRGRRRRVQEVQGEEAEPAHRRGLVSVAVGAGTGGAGGGGHVART